MPLVWGEDSLLYRPSIGNPSDVRRAIRFFRETRDQASGYTFHCWQGVSRSTAFALGFLYMQTESEEKAKTPLQRNWAATWRPVLEPRGEPLV